MSLGSTGEEVGAEEQGNELKQTCYICGGTVQQGPQSHSHTPSLSGPLWLATGAWRCDEKGIAPQ